MATAWEYTVSAKGTFGGFEAYLLESGAVLMVRALKWKGQQPRMILERLPKGTTEEWGYHDPGFEDWLPLLQPCNERHSFQGDDEHAQNLTDQWLFQNRGPNGEGPYARRADGRPA